MKKIIGMAVLICAMAICLVSCGHEHEYSEATCIAPRTCASCGETDGVPSSIHSFVDNKCSVCGLVRLTKDNFEDYLECNATIRAGNYSGRYYTSLKGVYEVKGNSHYEYSDVVIVVRFTHYDQEGIMQYYSNALGVLTGNTDTEEAVPYDEETCTVKLSLAGNGDAICELSAYPSDFDAICDRTFFEVISVTGTVKRYS